MGIAGVIHSSFNTGNISKAYITVGHQCAAKGKSFRGLIRDCITQLMAFHGAVDVIILTIKLSHGAGL